MVWQPDVAVEVDVVVSYEPGSVVGPQPLTEIDIAVEVDYTAPPSTGGQPKVICTIDTQTETDVMEPVMDCVGVAELEFVTAAVPSVEVPIAPIPPDVLYSPIRIVSVVATGSP